MVPWAHPISHPRLDRFSPFAPLKIVTERPTDRQTDRPSCYVCNNRPST